MGQAPAADAELSADDQRRLEDFTNQGQACWERQDYVGAINAYKAGLEIDPNNSDLKRRIAINFNDLGVDWYTAGDKEKALSYLQEAVSYDPSNPTAQKNLAAIGGKDGPTQSPSGAHYSLSELRRGAWAFVQRYQANEFSLQNCTIDRDFFAVHKWPTGSAFIRVSGNFDYTCSVSWSGPYDWSGTTVMWLAHPAGTSADDWVIGCVEDLPNLRSSP